VVDHPVHVNNKGLFCPDMFQIFHAYSICRRAPAGE
jgi:hypothetical protein